MAHHAHYVPSRINRIMNARHRREGDIPEVLDTKKSDLLPVVDQFQAPLLDSTDGRSPKPCDPSQNTTCRQSRSEESKVTVEKREVDAEVDATPGVVVQTIVQVVDTNSQTLWRSVGTEFPMTISDPAFGVVTVPGNSASADGLSLATSLENAVAHVINPPTISTDQPTASVTTSSTASTASTTTAEVTSSTTSKQLIQISSPKSSPTASSRSHNPSPSPIPTTSTGSANAFFIDTDSTTTTSSSSSHSDGWSSWSSASSYASSVPSSTSNGIVGAGPAKPTTTSSSGSGSGSSPAASTPQIVGSVVGSVAGVTILVVLLLWLLRRRQLLPFFRQKGNQTLGSDSGTMRAMSERGSTYDPHFSASYFAPAFMKRWRNSTITTNTESTVDTNSSERGFQKISGRKLPPVLTHGGDGYGGGLDGDSPTVPDCLIGLTPASPVGSAPPPSSPYGSPLDTNVTREADEHLSPTRPPNALMPVSNSVKFGNPTTVNQEPSFPQPQSAIPGSPTRPDPVGRSLSSYTGSRDSRFTESLDL